MKGQNQKEKIYPEFNNIKIEERVGVSPTGNDSKAIAKHAAKLRPKTALDMGSGNGFIPIYLKSAGIECDGADINAAAIEISKRNAEKNNIQADFYHSNLFKGITKKYGLIMFNPPYGSAKSAGLSRLIEMVKSFIPKGTILTKVMYPFIQSGRKKLIERFFQEAKKHLTEKGRIIILLDNLEMGLLKNKKYRILDTYGKGKLILVTAL